jgi:hypothetical protein
MGLLIVLGSAQMLRRNCDGPIEEVVKQSPREEGGEGGCMIRLGKRSRKKEII